MGSGTTRQEVGCGGRWDLGWDDLWMAQRGFSCNFRDDTARCILCLVTGVLKSFCAAPLTEATAGKRWRVMEGS